MEELLTREALITYLADKGRVEYILFWGHQAPRDGSINKSCFSQWYTAGFNLDNVWYPTAEHYMMAEKARLFKDEDALQTILDTNDPHEAKSLGRTIKNYDEKLWRLNRFEIVIRGNLAKFSQNNDLRSYLLNTGDKILVEASPHDCIWGIGLDERNPDAENPANWKGLNLLGFALMSVRRQLER